MCRGSQQTFLQRRRTDGQQTHEKMLNTSKHRRNANQNYSEVSPHTGQNGHRQKQLQTISAGEDVEKRELYYYWWECKLIQPLQRTVWRVLKKLRL